MFHCLPFHGEECSFVAVPCSVLCVEFVGAIEHVTEGLSFVKGSRKISSFLKVQVSFIVL